MSKIQDDNTMNNTQGLVFSYMSEGVMVIGSGGVIELINDAALSIFCRKREDLEGRVFARAFFEEDDTGANDEFRQSVLDAVYDKGIRQESYTPYTAQGVEKQLRIVSSYMFDGETPRVILVISDITELTQMRDAVSAMNKINNLNKQLEIRNKVLQETFGRYLSDEVVDEILNSPDGWKLGGQKKTLTIMLTDLRGFTALCERMPAKDLIDMLNHYFGEMYVDISKYNGTLIEFLGDGMLVIFGAPIHDDAHASNALAAAISMQNRMASINKWNEEHGYDPLEMGIGINTDEVILGNTGAERRIKYGVMGSAVNLTARIESYSTGRQILVSQNTLEMIDADVKITDSFEASPKGVKKPVKISLVEAIGAPFDKEMIKSDEKLSALDTPVLVGVYTLEGKHVSETASEGSIRELSRNEAVLVTKENLSVFDNIRLDIGDDLYAKVTKAYDDSYRITFTARPSIFKKWIEEILG
ncbi:MAG: PAS domain S-box protein [Lachnospiraceae bacterium]|nr:PAS domain S-box protein [Lachnospiraceae bacterium]